MSELQDVTANTTVTPAVTKRGGRSVDPNSNLQKARSLISGLPVTDRTRANVIPMLQTQLGLKKETASVYFYNIRKSL